MTNTNRKKKKPIVLFLLAFIVVVIVTFIANYKSQVAPELRGPNTGTEKLSVFGNRLIVISRKNETYVWNWDNLSAQPQVGSVNAQKVVALDSGRLLWLPLASNNTLVVSNLKGNEEFGRLSLGNIKRCHLLEASPNGKYAVTALEPAAPARQHGEPYATSDNQVKLAVIDPNLINVSEILAITTEGKTKLNDVAVSNDGAFIAAVGAKDAGWLLVANAKTKQLLWEQTAKDTRELNKVVFSPDGQRVYASEPGRYVYIFETTGGKTVGQLVMDKYQTSPNNPQTIGLLAASPDGRLFAATTEPASTACVWDIKTGQKITTFGRGFTISGLSFSPDSSLLVMGFLVRSNINIWKIPQKH